MYGRCNRVSVLNPWDLVDYVYTCKSQVTSRQLREFSNGHPFRKNKDYYEILGVKRDATQEEIKAAFYAKSKELHPDKGSSAESSERFVELKLAYDVLRRPADRQAYDMQDKEQCRDKFRDPYYNYNRYQQEKQREWSHYWAGNSRTSATDSDHKQVSSEQWRFIFRWTSVGIALAIMYNIGYILHLRARDRRLSSLVDEDEIAKSFMRQSEFRDRSLNATEMRELGRILKGDVDEAWRRSQEMMEAKNPNEIREEYRWLRAVRDVDHRRRMRAQRRSNEQAAAAALPPEKVASTKE